MQRTSTFQATWSNIHLHIMYEKEWERVLKLCTELLVFLYIKSNCMHTTNFLFFFLFNWKSIVIVTNFLNCSPKWSHYCSCSLKFLFFFFQIIECIALYKLVATRIYLMTLWFSTFDFQYINKLIYWFTIFKQFVIFISHFFSLFLT